MKAAIYHGPNQPLTIEQVDIDKPKEREVLVQYRRQRRVPQRLALRRRALHVADARDPGPRGGRCSRESRLAGHLRRSPATTSSHACSVFCGYCRGMHVGPSQPVLEQGRDAARAKRQAAPVDRRASRSISSLISRDMPSRCWCMRTRW